MGGGFADDLVDLLGVLGDAVGEGAGVGVVGLAERLVELTALERLVGADALKLGLEEGFKGAQARGDAAGGGAQAEAPAIAARSLRLIRVGFSGRRVVRARPVSTVPGPIST